MTVKLIQVGRGKVSKTVEVKNEDALLEEVMRHLMSKQVELVQTTTGGSPLYDVVVGGFRKVGEVKILTP